MFESQSQPSIAMKDLAVLAGCSVNTVSLALRNSHRISTATRERVMRLAKKHGYRPNPLVSALVSSRRQAAPAQTLAVLTKFDAPLFPDIGNVPLFCSQLLEGIYQKATELGFHLEEFPVLLPHSPDPARLTRILQARGIRGVFLFPSGDIATAFPDLDWQHFAVVAAGFHSKHLKLHRTATDQASAMEISLQKLQERGIRRIALALTRTLDPRLGYAASGRYFVWQNSLPEADRIPILPVDCEFPSEEQFEKWILTNRPEAVFLIHDYCVDFLNEIARKHGIRPLPILLTQTLRRDCCRADPQILNLGRTSMSVLARELFLNHYGLPAVPEVTLVGSAWHEPEDRPSTQAAESVSVL